MRDEEHGGAAVGRTPDRTPQPVLGRRVQGAGGLVEHQHAGTRPQPVERAGHADPLRLPAGEPGPLHAELLSGIEVGGRGVVERRAHPGGVGRGVAEGDVRRDRAADQARALPRPREPRGRIRRRRAVHADRPVVRDRAAQRREQTRLAGSAAPLHERHRAGLSRERHLGQPSLPVAHRDPVDDQPDPGSRVEERCRLSRGRCRDRHRPVSAGGRRGRRVQDLEHVLGRGDALGRGMELHAHLPQRQERLGRQEQDEQPDAEGQLAVEEPQPDRHRDDRDRQRRQQLQREPGEEGIPQHAQSLAPVLLRRLPHAGGGTTLPSEQPQRREALHGVGEARGERLQHRQLPPLHAARGDADQDQEQRDERQRHHGREPARPVLPPHHDDDHRRRDRGEHELRDVAGEVRIQRVEAVTRDHRQR
ncbi:hypothetical protein RL72_00664 [Microbacterium azadirachtae]|uniref:Uncharacterized protein n=1 Tax=Microbacterium azadirachtae TaxID=582680 RepID=A0A0F0L401_9MICO|nr:hypothetical protein RL72_00664 [Microbacterium azadirachtae]